MATETKHTPGPWHACTFDPMVGPHVFAGDMGCGHGRDVPRSEADANLIAAAPQMLAALRDAVKWCHGRHGDFGIKGCGLCKPLVDAIAKAEGRDRG